MTVASFVPLLLAAIVWFGFWQVNRERGWFTVGEIIFWDVIVLDPHPACVAAMVLRTTREHRAGTGGER